MQLTQTDLAKLKRSIETEFNNSVTKILHTHGLITADIGIDGACYEDEILITAQINFNSLLKKKVEQLKLKMVGRDGEILRKYDFRKPIFPFMYMLAGKEHWCTQEQAQEIFG